MKSPVGVNVVILVILSTGFYTWVGQLVPQKELQPPEEVALSAEMTPQDLARVGDEIARGKGLCTTCHTIGETGVLRFPDLAGIATRAGERISGMGALEYLVESLYDPDAYVVPGFNPGMPVIHQPPIGLSDDEIRAVIAWLQSLGGEPTMTLDTELPGRTSG